VIKRTEEPGSSMFSPVLYRNGQAVASTYHRYASQTDELEPPEDVDLDD
jgi:hypothetical protein